MFASAVSLCIFLLICSSSLTIPVTGNIEILAVEADSHTITLSWNNTNDIEDCNLIYVIAWKDTTDGSKNGCTFTTNNSYVINSLEACVTFKVSVSGLCGNCSEACEAFEASVSALYESCNVSEAAITNATTLPDVPSQVQDFSLKPGSYNINVNWKKPILTSYCVTHYVIYWVYTLSGSNNSSIVSSEENSFVIEHLNACTEYEVSVSALNEYNESMDAVTVSTTTETAVPGQVQDLSWKPGSRKITVNWMKPILNSYCVMQYVIYWVHAVSGSIDSRIVSSEKNSFVIENLDACVEYEVSVRVVNEKNEGMDAVTGATKTETAVPGQVQGLSLKPGSHNISVNWKKPIINSYCVTQYVIYWVHTLNGSNNSSIASSAENSFVIEDLDAYEVYKVSVRALNEKNEGMDAVTVNTTTESVVPVVPVAMIIGVLFAIIATGLIAVVVVTYHEGPLVWPPKLFRKARQSTVQPQPVLLKKLPEYCTQMLDTPTRLGNEYQLLETLSADIPEENSCVNGQLPENRRKNRHFLILPYDATRVTLDLIDGDPNSHYINASFIKGYSNKTEYIATQGPKEETCWDFWRMVFQHDVRVIVMVTNLIEQNEVKCHQYYPNWQESLPFWDMTIHCSTQTEFPTHTARTLVMMKGGKNRTLSHLQFREWPDFGVPQSTDVMIHFCQTVRRHALAAKGGLILVHCSAGVGQTGTLIAVDILLQHISGKKKVDVFGTVFKLRKQRVNMVQTEGQYTYIYRCIKDAVQDPMIVNPGTVGYNQLEPIYENVGISLKSTTV